MEKYNDFNENEKFIIKPSEIGFKNVEYVGGGYKPKRYKIKAIKAFEQEIDEEKKCVTVNTFFVGVTALTTATCFLLTGNPELEITQKIGSLLMGAVSSKGLYDSAKILFDSIKRKIKLEKSYFDTFGEEYAEKKGRTL